nr:hypothetical protein [uncultured Flavobacterium sp.]
MTFVSDLEIIVAKIQVVNVANDLAQMEVESFAAGVPIFFRTEKSDQRKLLLWHSKKGTPARTCNAQLEQLLKKESYFFKTQIVQMARNQTLTNVNKIDFQKR